VYRQAKNTLNPELLNKKPNYEKWLSMSEASQHTPYSSEYLSLLARKGKLSAKKIDNTWYTTLPVIEDYMKRQMIRAQVQNGNFSSVPKSLDVVEPQKSSPIINNTEPVKSVRSYHEDIQSYLNEFKEPIVLKEPEKLTKPPKLFGRSFGSTFFDEIINNFVGAADYLKKIIGRTNLIREAIENNVENSPSPLTVSAAIDTASVEQALERVLDKKLAAVNSPLLPKKHFKSFRTVFSSKMLAGIALVSILVSALLPIPVVFGMFEKSFDYVKKSLSDANTVLGFRPGTHANEILLLNKDGNVSIMGHIETEGQLRSYIADGTAPIVVDSKTMIKNLNAEYLGGASTTDFTLAFVTKNGAVTTEDVRLEGNVEVGKTLLVKGATKLLSNLSVRGGVSVFGDAEFNQTLKVLGPTYFESIVNMKSDVIAGGNLSVRKNVNIRGGLEVGSGLTAKSGSFTSLGVNGDLSASNIFGTNLSVTNATSTNFFAEAIGTVLNPILNIIANDISVGALTATNSTLVNSTSTNATTTNLFSTNSIFTNLTVTNQTISNALITNSTTTSATSTNFFATNGVFANLSTTNGSLVLINGTTTNATSTNLFSTNANFSNLLFGNATGTAATTTDLYISHTASTTNLFADSGSIGTLNVNSATLSNLLLNSSSTLQNFTFVNATGTQATTTNFFSNTGTFNSLYVNNYEQNNGTFNINSTVPTGNIFSVLDNAITNGTLIHQTLTANAGNGQISNGQILNLVDSTVAGGGYVGLAINISGSGIGSGIKYLLDLNAGANKEVVFDSAGAFRPTTSATNNTNSIGSPSFYWKNGYFDTLTANNLSGTVVTGATSNTTWTIGSTQLGDVNEALIFQRNGGTGNATLQWNASSGVLNDQRYLSVNYPFNANYTVTDTSIGTDANLYSGLLTNNTTSGTQKLLSLTNTGSGTTENGIYLNNTGTGVTAFEIAGTWTNGIVTNNNSMNLGTGGLIYGSATSTNATTTNFAVTNNLYTSLTQGSVPFIGAGGLLTQNNSQFFWDAINSRLGIGTTAPSNKLTVAGPMDVTYPDLVGQEFILSNDTAAKDKGGVLSFGGNFTGTTNTAWASILGRKENATDSNYAGYLGFVTRAIGDTGIEKMRITSAGNVGIGTSTPAGKVHIIKASTVNDETSGGINISSSFASTNAKLILGTVGDLYSYIQSMQQNTDWSTRPLSLQPNAGNVGIGTTAPGVGKLTISPSANENLLVRYGTVFGYAAGPVLQALNDAQDTRVAMSFDASKFSFMQGNVGVGTTTPTGKLSVLSNAATDNGIIFASSRGFAGNRNWRFSLDQNVEGTFEITPSTTLGGNTFTNTALAISNAGNVGVGDNNPTVPLSVKAASASQTLTSTTGTNAAFQRYVNTGGTGWFGAQGSVGNELITTNGLAYSNAIVTSGTQAIQFAPNNAAAMTILNGGNVGIGITNPNTQLQIVGTGQRLLRLGNAVGTGQIYSLYDNAGASAYMGVESSTGGTFTNTTPYSAFLINGNASDLQFGTSNTVNVTIKNGGNVGVGVTNPSLPLQVHLQNFAGLPATSGSTQSVGGRIRVSEQGAAILDIGLADTAGAWLQSTNSSSLSTNYPLLLNPNGGNVGIGVTNPTATLDVRGDSIRDTSRSATKVLGVTFPNGVANQKVDIYMTGIQQFWGTLDVIIEDGYSNQNASGGLTKRFYLGLNPAAAIYSNENRYTDEGGATADNYAISDLRWDAVNSRYYITIVHRVSTGNAPIIYLKAMSNDVSLIDSFLTFTTGSVYTTDATAYGRPYITFNNNVGVGTAYPKSQLHIGGNTTSQLSLGTVDYGGNSNQALAGLQVAETAGTGGVLYLQTNPWNNSSGVGVYNPQTRVTINEFGNVGIGTTNPLGALDVFGAVGSNAWQYFRTNSNGSNPSTSYNNGLAFSWNKTGGDGESNIVFGTGLGATPRLEIGEWNGAAYVADMVVKAGGNVGIGTTNPGEKLSVINSGSYASVLVGNGTNNSYFGFANVAGNYNTNASANDAIVRGYNGVSIAGGQGSAGMRLDSSGSLGIGTTAPGYKLDVVGAIRTSDTLHANSILSDALSPTYSALTLMGWAWPVGNKALIFTTHNDAGAGGFEKMVIMNGTTGNIYMQHNGGNVGIGTTNPLDKLDVAGIFRLSNSTTQANYFTTLNSNYDSSHPFALKVENNVGGTAVEVLGVYSPGGGGQNNLILAPTTGNVGIGTTAPGAKLEVASATDGEGLKLHYTGTTGGGVGPRLTLNSNTNNGTSQIYAAIKSYMQSGNDVNFGGDLNFYVADSGNAGTLTQRMTILTGGNVGIGITNPGAKLESYGAANVDLVRANYAGNTGGIGIDSAATYWGTSIFQGGTKRFTVESNNGILVGGTYQGNDAPADGAIIQGSVGIGTTAPVAKLETSLGGSPAYAGVVPMLYSSGVWPQFPRTIQNVAATITTNDTTVATGPVIGLNLENNSNTDGTYSPLITFSRKSASGSYNPIYASIGGIATGSGTDANWTAGDLTFGTAGVAGPLERMRIKSSGNVGIGTTAPTSGFRLDVAGGDVRILGAGMSPTLLFRGSAYPSIYGGRIQMLDYGDGMGLNFDTSDNLDAWGTKMVVRHNGNVGIGLTNPGAKLEVVGGGDIKLSGNVYNADFFVNGGPSDTFNASPWYGIGMSNLTLPGAGSVAVQVAGYYGINFATGNANMMVINQSGNVGIGTTNPGVKLDVVGNTYIRSGALYTDTINHYSGGGTPLALGTGGIVNILASGNVGIGTASPDAPPSFIPVSKLLVAGNGSFYSAIGAADDVRTGLAHYDSTAMGAGVGGQLVLGYKYLGSGYTEGAIIKTYKLNATDGDYSSGMKFEVRNTGAGLSTKMTLDPSGNLGIGTTNPQRALDLGSAGNSITFGNNVTGTAERGIYWHSGSTYGIYQTAGAWSAPDYQQLKLSWDTGIIIDGGSAYGRSGTILQPSGGNVGIGTTAPGGKLQVTGGDSSTPTIKVNAPVYPMIDFYSDNVNGNNRNWRIASVYNSYGKFEILSGTSAGAVPTTNRFTIDGLNGNVGIGTTAPAYKLDVGGNRPVQIDTDGGNIRIYGDTGGWGTGTYFIGSSGTNRGGFGALGGADALSYYWIGSAYNNATMIVEPSNGKVGIGDTTPTNKLDVSGYIGIRDITVLSSNFDRAGGAVNDIYGNIRVLRSESTLGDGMYIGYNGTGGPIRFFGNTGTTERMALGAAGGLSLGSGYIGTDAGAGNMIIQGTLGVGSTNSGNRGITVVAPSDVGIEVSVPRTTGTNYGMILGSAGAGATLNQGLYVSASGATSNYAIRIANPSVAAGNYAIYSEATAQSYFAGNMGIGTASPGTQLDVRRVNTDRNIATRVLTLNNYSTNNPYTGYGTGLSFNGTDYSNTPEVYASIDTVMIGYSSSVTQPDPGFKSALTFSTNTAGTPSEKMRIDNLGNVGIGTGSPGAGAKLDVAGNVTTGDVINLGNLTTVSTSAYRGITWESNFTTTDYAIYKPAGAWTQPLNIAFYTGIKLGANTAYGGTKFYNNTDFATELMSVGNGDNNVRVAYNLYTGGTLRLDSSGNLSNIGTITSGLINGQTISSAANFTGTVVAATSVTAPTLVVTGYGQFMASNIANNMKLKAGAAGATGITGYDSADGWRWQLYGDGTNYGFLNANWGGWDMEKTIGGALILNGNQTVLTSANYNSYAPTLTGTGASGTWGISITGSAGSATTATSAYYQLSQDRNRATMPAPNSRAQQTQFDFANAAVFGGTTGNYGGVMTWAPYDGTTASTGDASYQIGVVSTAANGGGFARLLIRKGIDTTWNAWQEIFTSSNYNSYSPTLTGTGASGTWGINVTGSAGSVPYSGISSLPAFAANAVSGRVRMADVGCAGGYASSCDGGANGYVDYADQAGGAFALTGAASPIYGVTGTAYSNAVQVREANGAGAQGAGGPHDPYQPRLAFHWSGVVASSITMENSGRIAIVNNPGTSYENFIANNITGASLNVGSGAITSGLINGQTISSAANFTGTVAAATSFTAPYYSVSAANGYGVCFWTDCTNYKVSMSNGADYQYGPVTDYSIKLTMGSGAGRGVTFGSAGNTPVAAINTTSGDMKIAGTFTGKLAYLTSDYTVDSLSPSIAVGDIVAYINGNAERAHPAVSVGSMTSLAAGFYYESAAALDSTHFVVVYANSSGYASAVVSSVSGATITPGTPVVLQAVGGSSYVSVAALDSTHFVTVWASSGNPSQAVVSSVSGTTITVGTPTSLGTPASSLNDSVAALDATHFVAAYKNSTTGLYSALVGTVSGTTITAVGTPVALYGSSSLQMANVSALDSTHFVGAYRDAGTGNTTAVVSSVSGTTITVGTPVSFGGNTNNYMATATIDSTHFVVTYLYGANLIYAVVGSVSGTTITVGTPVNSNIAVTPAINNLSVTGLGSTHFVVQYQNVTANTYAYIFVGTVSGTTITTIGAPTALNSVSSAYQGITSLDATHFVSAYEATTVQANVSTYIGELTSSKLLGMATNSASAGGTVTVASSGIVSGLSSLTAGSTYYYGYTTGLTTNSSAGYKVGIALSTTSMLLNSGNGAGTDQFFGDMIFANAFRITEAENSPQALIFKSQLGREIMRLDENGNLDLSGTLSASNVATTTAFQINELSTRMLNLENWAASSTASTTALELAQASTTLSLLALEQNMASTTNEIFTLNTRVTNLENLVASSTALTLTASTTESIVSSVLATMGASIINGVTQFKQLAVESLSAFALTIGTKDKPTGITLYDQITGAPFCMKIVNGQPVSTAGDCSNPPSSTPAPSATLTTSTTTPITTASSTPSTIVASTTTTPIIDTTGTASTTPIVSTTTTTTSTTTASTTTTTTSTTTASTTTPII